MRNSTVAGWLVTGSLLAQAEPLQVALAAATAVADGTPAAKLAAADVLRERLAATADVPLATLWRLRQVARELREQHLERAVLERLLVAVPRGSAERTAVAAQLGDLRLQFGDLPGARELLEEAAAGAAGGDPLDRWWAQARLARLHGHLGDEAAAISLGEAAVAGIEALGGDKDLRFHQARAALANTLLTQEPMLSRNWLRQAVAAAKRLPGIDPVVVLALRSDHCRAEVLQGTPGATEAEAQLLADCETALPATHLLLHSARCNVADRLKENEPATAWRLVQPTLAELARRGPDVPIGHMARLIAVVALRQLGEPAAAEPFAAAEAKRLNALPAVAALRLEAEAELAECRRALGDLEGALTLQQQLWATVAGPPPLPQAWVVAGGLAATLGALGDWEGAAEYSQRQLQLLDGAWPKEVTWQVAKANAAFARFQAGRPHGVQGELEAVVAVLTKSLGAAAPATRAAAEQLAAVRLASGDAVGALAAFTAILAALPEAAGLLGERALLHVAVARASVGDPASAAGLFEQVVASRCQRLGGKAPAVARVRANLARTYLELGRTQDAVELLQLAMADLPESFRLERALIASELAGGRLANGEAAAAAAQAAAALASLRQCGDAAAARWPAAFDVAVRSLAAAGDQPAVRATLAEWSLATRQWLAQIGLAPRERLLVAARAEVLADRLASAVVGAEPLPAGTASAADLALVVESLRGVAVRAARAAQTMAASADQALVAELSREWRTSAAAVAALAAGDAGAEHAPLAAALRSAVERRDRALRQLLECAGPAAGIDLAAATTRDLAAALPEGAVAVALRRLSPGDGEAQLLACVLHRDGAVACRSLGAFAKVVAAVRELRQAGFHAGARRGLGRDVLAPVAAMLPPATAAIVLALDGELQGVPWDAIEMPDAKPFGAAVLVRTVDSWFDLLDPQRQRPMVATPSLVAFGGIDYAAGADQDGTRGSVGGFAPLPESAAEVAAIADLWREQFAEAAVVARTAADADWDALVAAAPTAQVLHLATHGWFEPEQVDGIALRDTAGYSAWQLEGLAPRSGLAPFTRCGIALSRANAEERGRVRGEQLAALDLAGCQVAVLSACHGAAGLPEAGAGLASLRAALRAAGARFVVAAPWPVDDAATAALLLDFHRRLWAMPAAERDPVRALWQARQAAAERQVAWRDWAGWTVVGL